VANNQSQMPVVQMQGTSPEDDEVDLREIYDLLKAGRWTICVFVVGVLLLGILYVVFAQPVYRVSGTVQVDESANGASGLASSLGGLAGLLSGAPLQTEAEMQIMQSRLVLDPVIDQLGLLVTAQPHYFPLIGRTIAHWNSDAAQPVGAPPLLGRYAWGGERIEVSQFETDAAEYDRPYTLTVTADGYALTDRDGNPVLTGKVGQPAQGRSGNGTVKILVSRLAGRVGEQFRVTRRARQSVVSALLLNLSVNEQGKQSGIVSISYSDHDRLRAKTIVDAIENSYIEQNISRNSAQAKQSLQFLEKQLPDLHKKLDLAQAQLAHYQQTHGAADVSSETQLLLSQTVALQTQRSQLIQQREQALQRFTAQHPVIKGLDRQIATLEGEQAKLEQKIGKLPGTQQEVLSLMRNLDVNTQLYTTILDAIQQFQVSKAGTVGDVRIVDYGTVPLNPESPKKNLTLVLSLILGGFLGVAYVFLRRMLLRGVDDPTVIERSFGLSVLASIPYDRGQRRLMRAWHRGELGSHLLTTLDQNSLAIEALRSLRTALHFDALEASNNVIMLAGPAPAIGKSFIAANYATVLALTGKRVVVVDVDLRKGHLHQYFDAQDRPGVSNYVAGSIPVQSLIQSSGVEGLDFIARGGHPPNPAELLTHDRFKGLIEALSSTYDYVILDTPPVLAVTDAAIVGKLAGTTLLVLKSAEHPRREIEETLKRLSHSGVRVQGVLMNQVGAKAGAYGYGNYGYSYYSYKHQ